MMALMSEMLRTSWQLLDEMTFFEVARELDDASSKKLVVV
jgi:hypothetical protein